MIWASRVPTELLGDGQVGHQLLELRILVL
jgi:hypothetical protein